MRINRKHRHRLTKAHLVKNFSIGFILVGITILYGGNLWQLHHELMGPAETSPSSVDFITVGENEFLKPKLSMIRPSVHTLESTTSSRPPKNSNCNSMPAVEDLIRRLNEDPERNGLRQLDGFSGLSKQALEIFSGRRIAFIGDSTLLYLSYWLQLVLTQKSHNNHSQFLDQMDLSTGQNASIQLNYVPCEVERTDELDKLGLSFMPREICDQVTWGGMQQITDHRRTEALLQAAWKSLEDRRNTTVPPDILIVNQGIHWLHFYDNQNHTRDTSAEAIRRWIFYEDWLQEVYDHASTTNKNTGVRLLLYKTTNYICDDKLYGWFQKSHRLYQSQDPSTLQLCQQLVRDELERHPANVFKPTRTINENDIANYCVNGTINNHGSMMLNARMVRFVEQKLMPKSTAALRVGIYNDHDLQSCQHCGHEDGLHYHNINLMRIRLLVNQLQAAMVNNCP